MKKLYFLLSLLILLVVSISIGFSYVNEETPRSLPEEETSIASEPFDKMMQVLTHKRCMNCHPAGETPHQGEDSHLHYFGVQRGPDNHGVAALRCETCHQEENNLLSGVPGAPEWSVAPKSMYWEGLSRVEIAKSMLDPKKNGGRSLDELVHHLTEHALVLWAWEPGVDANGVPREKPPVPLDEYIKAVKDWAEAGAIVPAE